VNRAGVPLHGNEKITSVRKQLQAASATNNERAFNVIARNMKKQAEVRKLGVQHGTR
jgi:hypothetical protein